MKCAIVISCNVCRALRAFLYSQVPNKRPLPHINFSICSNPLSLIRTPRLLILRNRIFTKPSFYFVSFLVLFTPIIQGKTERFCIYFSSMLHDSLFLFFPSFSNHLKPCLKFLPPFILTPRLLNFRIFSDPQFIRIPVYLALESKMFHGLEIDLQRPFLARIILD